MFIFFVFLVRSRASRFFQVFSFVIFHVLSRAKWNYKLAEMLLRISRWIDRHAHTPCLISEKHQKTESWHAVALPIDARKATSRTRRDDQQKEKNEAEKKEDLKEKIKFRSKTISFLFFSP